MEQKIVLISGKQGSGKTSLACNLSSYAKGWGVVQCTFAEVIYELHNTIRIIMGTHGIKVSDKKDGELLQYLGTEWGRAKFGHDVWVNCLRNKITTMSKAYNNQEFDHLKKVLFVISDCRFQNEFDAFPEALRVRLRCGRDERKKRCEYWRENDTHASEVNLDSYSNDELFDLYLDTENTNQIGNATLLMAQVEKNVWKEKR